MEKITLNNDNNNMHYTIFNEHTEYDGKEIITPIEHVKAIKQIDSLAVSLIKKNLKEPLSIILLENIKKLSKTI